MATAEYEVVIPPTGQDIASHALQYVHTHFKPEGTTPNIAHVERGREMFMNGAQAPHDVLVVKAEDTPYTDSFLKQLAHYVGDVAQVPVMTVSKNGKQGINVWPIRI